MSKLSAAARSVLIGLGCLWLSTISAWAATSGLLAPEEQNRLFSQIERRPMIFFVAKGPADSCGPGCSEWIAAQGRFEAGTAQRFRDLIQTLGGRDLPVFFHSPGGLANDAIEIAGMMRERRMTAGVARTVVEQCRVFDQKDTSCQKLIKTGGNIKARLLPSEGQCHSACVYAFAGASVRRVAPGALLGVHSPVFGQKPKNAEARLLPNGKKPSIAEIHRLARAYFIELGLDSRLEDLAAKTSHQRMYVLSREEIARLGVETRGIFETPWALHEASKHLLVMKSVTFPAGADAEKYLTLQLSLFCEPATGLSNFGYRRELLLSRSDPPSVLGMRIDERKLSFKTRVADGAIELGSSGHDFASSQEFWSNAIALREIRLIETRAKPDSASLEARELKLSTTGLSDALVEFRKRCNLKGYTVPRLADGSPAPSIVPANVKIVPVVPAPISTPETTR